MRGFRKLTIPTSFSLTGTLLIAVLSGTPLALLSQTHTVNAAIDISRPGAPISKNIYGQFLEHGGDIVNTGVWSEMLVDRKFFYPLATSAPTPPPVMGNAAGNPRLRRTPTRWWSPIGGEANITMAIDATVQIDKKPEVQVEEQTLGPLPVTITVRPFSVNIYSYSVQ